MKLSSNKHNIGNIIENFIILFYFCIFFYAFITPQSLYDKPPTTHLHKFCKFQLFILESIEDKTGSHPPDPLSVNLEIWVFVDHMDSVTYDTGSVDSKIHLESSRETLGLI